MQSTILRVESLEARTMPSISVNTVEAVPGELVTITWQGIANASKIVIVGAGKTVDLPISGSHGSAKWVIPTGWRPGLVKISIQGFSTELFVAHPRGSAT